jgi:hypothetical protein
LFLTATVGHFGASLFHRDLVEDVGEIDESLMWTEDHDYFLRLAAAADMVFSPTIAFHYRRHNANITNSNHWPPGYWHVQMLEKHLRDPAFRRQRARIRRLIAHFRLSNSYYYREHGQPLKAIREALTAISRAPSEWRAWRETVPALLLRR